MSLAPINRDLTSAETDVAWRASGDVQSLVATDSQKANGQKADGNLPADGPEEPISEPADFFNRAIMLTAIIAPFLGFLAGIYYCWTIGWMGWPFLVLIVMAWCMSGMGVTIGFHRLLTHSSFETYKPLRALWMMMGALSIEGSPLVWCAVHRKHHQRSDELGDPHSPNLHGKGLWNAIRGFFYGHCGWLLTTHWSKPDLSRYVPDLLQDKFLVWVDRFYYLWVLTSFAMPAGIGVLIAWLSGDPLWKGALLGILWGGLVRVFMGHHITWSINSVCHMFGKRDYQTTDKSTNNLTCALLGFGEGWHNNHHAFPTSARHGLRWWEFDISWLTILMMKKLRLAWNVKVPSPELMATKRIA